MHLILNLKQYTLVVTVFFALLQTQNAAARNLQWDIWNSQQPSYANLIYSGNKHFLHFHFKVSGAIMPEEVPIDIFLNNKRTRIGKSYDVSIGEVGSVNIATTVENGNSVQTSLPVSMLTPRRLRVIVPRKLKPNEWLSVRVFIDNSQKLCEATAIVNRHMAIPREKTLRNNESFLSTGHC